MPIIRLTIGALALAEEGMSMTHVIGPQTAHRYHPAARQEINRRLEHSEPLAGASLLGQFAGVQVAPSLEAA